MTIARIAFVLAGAAAIAWAVAVMPVFWSQSAVTAVAQAIERGEIYKPEVLAAVEAGTHGDSKAMRRPSNLGQAAIIRLRMVEDSLHGDDKALIERRLDALSKSLDEALANTPGDSFLWFVRFWADSARNGLQPQYLRSLKMSYDLGRYEGWIAVRRNRYALVIFSTLPAELAGLATSEFADFVRWGLVQDAAAIAAGPGRPIRAVLYERLKNLAPDKRRSFARLMYQRGLDDVLIPGVIPPPPRP